MEKAKVNRMKRNIILIGFAGTGKTTIGQALSEKLQWKQVDCDHWIESKTGRKIAEIFEQFGEEKFRDLETQALADILQQQGQVVTTGGGSPLREKNKELMLHGGVVISLIANAETIIERVKGDQSRPLFQGNMEEKITALMEQRKGIYDFAEVHIDTNHKKVEQIVEEIILNIQDCTGLMD